jgi:hypothetical protein
MDRRSLISGALGGAAGVVVGRELAPTSAGAAADVDRSEFEALAARVAYLEQFHDPMPDAATSKFSGAVSLPEGFVVPFGEVWDFDPQVSTTVEVGANVVVAGTLQMRPASPGVVHTLRFVGVDESLFVGGGMDPIDTDVGLWVVGAGKLDLAGSPKTAWVRASAIGAGASTVTLMAEPDGWQVGDTVVIAPTAAPTVASFATQYDTATVQSIDGATLALSAPTLYAHPTVTVGPGMTYGAEVMNLSRNVRIEGTPTGRAHGWITSSVPQTVDFVQLRHLGPRQPNGEVTAFGPTTTTVLGRYPLHFHMCGSGSVGTSVHGTVSWDSGAHAFVPHQSHGITFDGCIAHDTMDDPFWWDVNEGTNDGAWRRCIASKAQTSPHFRGYRLSGFSLGTGDRNLIEDCVAVGIGGASLAGGFIWQEQQHTNWDVVGAVAHNNVMQGFTVWQNPIEVHTVDNFTCYHNGDAGINHGAYVNAYQYTNGFLYGNKGAAIALHAGAATGALPMKFEAIRCDTAGYGGRAVALPKHTLLCPQSVVLAGCDLIGHTGATLQAVATVASKPTLVDVIDCGPVSISWNSFSDPASVVRVQDGGTAQQFTPAGVVPIATFSTMVPARAQAFPVPAAA